MATISLSMPVFVIMCIIIIILLAIVIALSILVRKMKSKEYKRLIEQGESTVITISSNRYNNMFQNNKESDDLLNNIGTKLNFHESCLVPKTCQDSTPIEETQEAEDQIDSVSDKKGATMVPSIMARQQIALLCDEIMRSKNADNFKESHELKDLSSKKKTPIRSSIMDRSMSTPELDIYDVVPSKVTPVNYNNTTEEEETEYALPKSDSKVVLDVESGYYMPLSLTMKTYANAHLQ